MTTSEKWSNYLTEKKSKASFSLTADLLSFLETLQIKKVEYDEFNDESLGEIGVHYFQFNINGKDKNAEHTSYIEGYQSFWSLPSEIEEIESHFDNWLACEYHFEEKALHWLTEIFLEFANQL